MRVVLDNEIGETSDVELRLGRGDATVGDLLDALPDGSRAQGILLDGRFCHVDLSLGEIGLYEGARIRAAADHADAPGLAAAAGPLELRVIAGFDAGRRVPLGPGGVVVGRDLECDLTLADESVSRRHLRVAPSPGGRRALVTDLDSVNGTWVEGARIRQPVEVSPGELFEAGDVAFVVAPPPPELPIDPLREAGLGGTIPFNRPPRAHLPRAEEPLLAPEAPAEASRPRLSVASALGPLLLGGVMVVLLHSIIYALFMLLSPVLVIGSWIEQRRQVSRSARGGRREYERALAQFGDAVARRRGEELAWLRDTHPDLAEVVRRAQAPDPRLWERRPEDGDFLSLSAGYGEVPFRPALGSRAVSSGEAERILAENGWLELAPVAVELAHGGVVGIVGDRAQALSLARALLCQAVVLHGPADLTAAVFCEPEAVGEWDWVKWLPHLRDSGGAPARQLAVGQAAGAALAAELSDRDEEDPRRLLAVLDSPPLIEGRGAAGRALLRGRGDRGTRGGREGRDRHTGAEVSGIVIARSAQRLPAACTVVVELADEAGEARLLRPRSGQRIDPLLVAGMSLDTARDCALALARFEDADLRLEGGALPDQVSLLAMLGLPEPSPEAVQARWRASRGPGLGATFTLGEDGPLEIDLVADGPHGLIAGTTGAGKSELLRSLVAALAATHPPERVTFVLIDYKGGSAFGECAALPHTVGLVTDLDEHLGERALRSLEAELRFRERVLRDAQAPDLIAYDELVGAGRVPPLPRLLVVIDEFATLAAELPDFVPSLVGIAQRGRSLGVHLILATQRPSGAVNENIRANTNLRVCLRVQTAQDSQDVIDSPAAARIPRRQPGRAQVRLGPSELIPVQTALASGTTAGARAAPVILEPFGIDTFAGPAPGERSAGDASSPQSDLARLATAARSAHGERARPRRPWLEPLPGDVALAEVTGGRARPLAGERGLIVPFALGDDPDGQAQYPVGWNLNAGNLLLFGIGGSGTTTALSTIALSLAELADPRALHLYALDFGAGELNVLSELPHVGAVIAASEHERQRRLLGRLRDELGRRRGLDAAAREALPRIVLLIDGYGGFVSEHSDIAGDALRETMARVWADGPELGVHTVIAADRIGAVPTAMTSLAQQRLALALADPADYAQFGLVRRAIPRLVPGRAIVAGSSQLIQIARPSEAPAGAVARVAARIPAPSGGPAPIGVLPERVGLGPLLAAGRSEREPLFIPLGIGDERLEAAGLELYEGDHGLIAGPPRSGRSTGLLTAAAVLARLYPDIPVGAIALRRSPLRDCPTLDRLAGTPDEVAALVGELRAADHLHVLLIDDADALEDPTRALSDLFSAPLAHLHAIVAGRSDALRSLGHWSVGVRRSRAGVLLQPDLTADGPLLGAVLPRRPAPPLRPGCGFRVAAGGHELIQLAVPE
jgi:S-DNA-T family DNA segregation ATPase FtsK/SpoIIIE